MLLPRVTGALLLATSSVHALRDAAPFFVLSPESLNGDALPKTQIATAADVENNLLSTLSSDCKQASYYILIQQPGIKASYISKESMPRLYTRLNGTADTKVVSTSVPEVVGEWNLERTAERLARTCGIDMWREDAAGMRKDAANAVMTMSLPALEGADRAMKLADTDNQIESLVSLFSNPPRPWTIVFSGSRKTALSWEEENQEPPYEMDEPFPSGMHTDLKRDVELHRQQMHRRQSNSTDNPQSGLPLFEKYKFLSPAIFMGLTVSILLMSILYIGITAIAGLEVSYFAFSKEMGTQAQKGKVPQ